jgi:hypothetical protein
MLMYAATTTDVVMSVIDTSFLLTNDGVSEI